MHQEEGSHSQSHQETYQARLSNSTLSQEKVAEFYQSLEKLKQFYNQIKFLKINNNNSFDHYLSILPAQQQKTKNKSFLAKDIIQLAEQRIESMIKLQRIRKNWTVGDRVILNQVVKGISLKKQIKNVEQFTQEDWQNVSELIPGSIPNACMFKWLSMHKTNVSDWGWTEDQENALRQLANRYVSMNKAINWRIVSKDLYLKVGGQSKAYRSQRQCKEHWLLVINPNKKREAWTQQEDILLFKTIKQNSGLKKWSQMVQLFSGRTQNAVKNRFNLVIQKQRKIHPQNGYDELKLIDGYLQRCYVQKFTKIIEPDSEEEINQKKIQQKRQKLKQKYARKNGRKSKNFAINKKNRFEDRKIEKFHEDFNQKDLNQVVSQKEQFKTQGAYNHKELVDGEGKLNTIRVQPYENSALLVQRLGSVQIIPHFHDSYNHRTNDIDFDFTFLQER